MAYAAITSLMNTIQQSMESTGLVLQLFYEKLESLRAIMENPCNITGDHEALTSLEAQMAELADEAEYKVDLESRNIFLPENEKKQRRAFVNLYSLVKEVVGRIDSTMKKWMAIQNKLKNIQDLKAQNLSLVSTSRHGVGPQSKMIGLENEFEMMQDQLSRGARELEVVSVVGMGGIGKTTLANKLYSDPFIMSHFDIRAKATVSQEYCARNVLLRLLSSISGKTNEFQEQQDDDQLADRLQKLLKCGRYLVVTDDIWTREAWDDIKRCFPDCNNGSRILLTTRNVEVAECASSGKTPYHMRLMNFDESWSLLYEKVFVKDCFSPEFEQLGKTIALNCGGLPLALVLIAGLLSKMGKSLDEWKSIVNVSSTVNTEVNVQCMRVVALSYHYLPHHLKPCFLYFAIFQEDELILVNKLVELWAAEGFLKVEERKSIEEVAEKCLKELIDRSLISIRNLSFDGKIEICEMHDVTRELCLREARNMNIVNVTREEEYQNPCVQSMHFSSKSRGRISIQEIKYESTTEKILERYPKNGVRSIICCRVNMIMPKLLHFKLVRVLDLALMGFSAFPSSILDLIYLRYLALRLSPGLQHYLGEEISSSFPVDIPPSISSLCYLQTFILRLLQPNARQYPLVLPNEILTMPQLRHLLLDWNYLQYHEPMEKSLVLKNLQCMSGLNPWHCTRSVFRQFPNLKKLQICGIWEDFRSRKDLYDFHYLDKLEELDFVLTYSCYACFLEISITSSGLLRFTRKKRRAILLERPSRALPPTETFPYSILPPPDAFPQNLKKLAFYGTCLQWKDLSIVGKLPKLEALKLGISACVGVEWKVVKDGFPSLKFLLLERLKVRYWRASCDHFPCLERLFLEHCWDLDSIPQDFADITTLALIDIRWCAESVGNSAKQIQEGILNNYASFVEVNIHEPQNKQRGTSGFVALPTISI